MEIDLQKLAEHDLLGDFRDAYGLDLQQGSHGASLFNAVPAHAGQTPAPQHDPATASARRAIRSPGVHCWQLRRGA
jgi:hypothetical protein